MVLGSKPWFIKFYTNWCAHCKELEPTWEELIQAQYEQLNVASVDCAALKGLPLCNTFGVHQMPTLLYFPTGGNKYYRYDQGDRSLESLTKFAIEGGWEAEPFKTL